MAFVALNLKEEDETYTSAEFVAFRQQRIMMMKRRTRIRAPEAEILIITANSHVMTFSVQKVPSYR